MSSANSVVTVFQNLFSNHGSTLLNIILVVSTIGGQSIIRKLTFSCPCAYPLNVYHSLVFIVGPATALFIIGIVLNTTTWRIVHGTCFRVSETRPSWSTLCTSWVEIVAQALLAPAAWLFVVFLDGGYYRCLMSHNYCSLNTAHLCMNTTLLDYYRSSGDFDEMSGNGKYCPPCICNLEGWDAANLEAQSQIYAWIIVVLFGVGTFLVICVVRMCDKYTYVQHQYVETYKSEETNKFDSVAREHASQLAERNARAFFNQKDWTKRDWDWVSGVAEINNPMFARLRLIAAEKTKTTMYTPLQLWNDHKGYRILQPEVLAVDETQAAGVIVPDDLAVGNKYDSHATN
uniref:Calcium homeostasis modulator protein n=2 Tax=Haemonchus contortus TaxID=6289 RepID=A0A7I4Z6T7_HAECO